jgi:hypothetical protein
MTDSLLRWSALAGLGIYHGINPAMGWLFAVALGLQERSGRAVLRALPPLALGHAASVSLVVTLLFAGQRSLPNGILRPLLGLLLIGSGVYKLLRPRHPRWVGMRVGFRDLTLWSFLMATAHGAGLMLVPVFLLSEAAPCHGEACHAAIGLLAQGWPSYVAAVAVHTGAMLAAAGALALVVYHRVGLAVLRQSWFNLDYLWAGAMVLSGALALIL